MSYPHGTFYAVFQCLCWKYLPIQYVFQFRECSHTFVYQLRTESHHEISKRGKPTKALVETAELNLSYTVIVAPCDGYTSRKEIQVGQLVQPGQTLLDIVDSGDIWVTANYKETQLHNIRPGSKVDIRVDAVPGALFKGTVISISTATGSALSLIPQDNSAGNFVKVRQRVPVRIEFDPGNNAEDMAALRAGMNVECSVRYLHG